jgi:hypothetical protein
MVRNMKKKIGIMCFFMLTTLLLVPLGSSYHLQDTQQNVGDMQGTITTSALQKDSKIELFTGYVLIHVFTYQPGMGFHPCEGANVSVKGFFHKYTGTTDEMGDCLFVVHTNILRAKIYFIKVSIFAGDRVLTKRMTIFIEPRQIVYKEFLFIVL